MSFCQTESTPTATLADDTTPTSLATRANRAERTLAPDIAIIPKLTQHGGRTRWWCLWETNDFADSACEDAEFGCEAVFTEAYTKFFQQSRGNCPEALLVASVGPMLKDETLMQVRGYVSSVVQEMEAGRDEDRSAGQPV